MLYTALSHKITKSEQFAVCMQKFGMVLFPGKLSAEAVLRGESENAYSEYP